MNDLAQNARTNEVKTSNETGISNEEYAMHDGQIGRGQGGCIKQKRRSEGRRRDNFGDDNPGGDHLSIRDRRVDREGDMGTEFISAVNNRFILTTVGNRMTMAGGY